MCLVCHLCIVVVKVGRSLYHRLLQQLHIAHTLYLHRQFNGVVGSYLCLV